MSTETQIQVMRLRTQVDQLAQRIEELGTALERAQHDSRDETVQKLQGMLAPVSDGLRQLGQHVGAHEKEREQLRALQEVGGFLNSSLDLGDVLRKVMDAIIRLTGAERGFLMLRADAGGEMDVRVARNMDRQTLEQSSFDISRSIVQSVAATGEPVVTINAQSDPRFAANESIISYNLLSILCVPLRVKDEITGVIYADNRIASGIFNDQDRDLLADFGNQAAVAIDNARLFEQITRQLADITEMKNLMDDVFASIASGVITIDTFDKVALFNRAAERILDVEATRVLDKRYNDVFADVAGFTDMVEQVKGQGGQHNVELDTVIGQRRGAATLNFTFSPLKDVDERATGVTVVMDDVSEKKRLESVRRYLPPALVEQVRDVDLAQRPQRRRMSVLFADLRGYSTVSEHMAPERLIQVINGHFTVAAAAINRFEGIIDKYMGDAIMAEFNTTLNPQVDHVARAVRAALLMQEEVAVFHEGLPPGEQLTFRIGLHVGEAVVGNVGTHFRKDFTVIGDAVNLAKRLQENAKIGQILVSQAVYEEVKAWVEARPLPPMQVKGRQAVEQFYELIGLVNGD